MNAGAARARGETRFVFVFSVRDDDGTEAAREH